MSPELMIAAVGAGLAILGAITFVARRPHKDLDRKYYQKKWRDLQRMCAQKDTWPVAIIQADNLLDEALKKRHFKGKTMGERMVAAQRSFSSNDTMWFAHKLRNQLVHEVDVKLSEKDVKNALVGIRQALRDLGAL
jgi:hypothetical protein